MMRELCDAAMAVSGMIGCGFAMVLEILLSFVVDSTGAVPAATAATVRVSWIGLAVCGAVFAACLAGRLFGWLRRRPRGVKLGVMSAEEICAACRRMRR
nr:MAG TPA: hypothetical protein [Caudoviricetes sp.]